MSREFDLTVIGGGPGGYVSAIRAAQLGLKVAIAEEREMGGTCLNRGCIPTKSLLHSAEVYHMIKSCSGSGIEVSGLAFDFAGIAQKKENIVKQLRSGVEQLIRSSGSTVICGKARIMDQNSIEISGKNRETIKSDRIIIATGSRSAMPPIPGINNNKVLNSDGLLGLAACPKRIVIIGGGVIGVEFAEIYSSFGSEVTVIEMLDTILPGIDSDISSQLKKSLESKGVKIYTGSRVLAICSDMDTGCTFESNGKQLNAEADVILVATGRKPNTEDIGLENIGLCTEKGFIGVDERLETAVKGIYAVGDVTGKALLAHLAMSQGLIAAGNAAGRNERADYSIIPACIYTNPEIAVVGLTEAEAVKRGLKVKVGRFPVSSNGKSILSGEKEGFAKIIVDEATGEILGAHVICQRASDIISEMCLAMKLEATVEEVAATIHPHPTVSEILMEAAHDVQGLCINKPRRAR